MLFFDLKDFEKEDMLAYLKCMAAIAGADGNVGQEERAYYNYLMELFKLPEPSKMHIRRHLDNPPPLGPVLKEITNPKVKNQIVRDAYLMAYVDEEIQPEESKVLTTVAGIFRMDETKVQIFSEWAKKGMQWRKEGYELSILED